MTKLEMMKELEAANVKFNKKDKKEIIEKLYNELTAKTEEEEKEMKKEEMNVNETVTNETETAKTETKKEIQKVKYTRDERLANIASLIANDAYDNNLTIKLMSNKSVAIKQDRKRLFRLDLLNKEYQLTSDRDTLLQADTENKVEAIYKKSKDKYFYRFRTDDKNEVIELMKAVIKMYR